jgi:hypothetical protein
MRQWFLRVRCQGAASLLISVAASLGATTASAAPLTQTPNEQPTYAWLMVLAVLLAATAVQLLIDVLWNYGEWLLINLGKWQVSHLKGSAFMRFKAATSLLLAALLGMLIANATGMRLMEYMQSFLPTFLVGAPQAVDVLITGLLIGALTAPIHDFFGIIAGLKNMTAANARKQREAAADALAGGVLKLAQSEAQATVDIPGIGPARLPTPGVETAEGATPEASQSLAERYATILHDRTVD